MTKGTIDLSRLRCLDSLLRKGPFQLCLPSKVDDVFYFVRKTEFVQKLNLVSYRDIRWCNYAINTTNLIHISLFTYNLLTL
jgi:hypothetical protein